MNQHISTNESEMETFIARWAKPSDMGEVLAIFKDNYIDHAGVRRVRPDTVFPRTRETTIEAIKDNRALILTDVKGRIKATGFLHLHPTNYHLATRLPTDGTRQPFGSMTNIPEIGGVYGVGDGPKGFRLELIYDLLILQALNKARECAISLLTTQVVANNSEGIKKVIALQHCWEQCLLDEMYTEHFKGTLADPACKDIPLSAFVASPKRAVMAAAESLLGLNGSSKFDVLSVNSGRVIAFDYATNKKVIVDMSSTGLLSKAEDIIFNDPSKDIVNVKGDISWLELNQILLKPREPLFQTRPQRHKRPSSQTAVEAAALRS